jgi:hypothetical protein
MGPAGAGAALLYRVALFGAVNDLREVAEETAIVPFLSARRK